MYVKFTIITFWIELNCILFLPFRSDWKRWIPSDSSLRKEMILLDRLAVAGNDSAAVWTCIIRLSVSFCIKAMSRHVCKVCFSEEYLSHIKHSIAFLRKLLNILCPPPWLRSNGVSCLMAMSTSPAMADITRCTLHVFSLPIQVPLQSFSTDNWYTLFVPVFVSLGYEIDKSNIHTSMEQRILFPFPWIISKLYIMNTKTLCELKLY